MKWIYNLALNATQILGLAAGCSSADGPHGTLLVCTPGIEMVCACAGGKSGVQTCAIDGKAFGACKCDGSDLGMSTQDLATSSTQDLAAADLRPPPDMATPFPFGPTANWTLDEASGNALDTSGNSLTGTVTNGSRVAAKHGNGMSCDGSTTFADVGNPNALKLTGAMTLSAWVNITSFATAGRIISKGGGPGQRGWSLNVENTSVASFKIATDTNLNINVDTVAGTVPTGQWVHLAGVYEPGVALRIYVNGVLNNSLTTGVPATQFDQALNVNIGRRTDGTYFSGVLDEVRVYNQALTAQQVVGLAK